MPSTLTTTHDARERAGGTRAERILRDSGFDQAFLAYWNADDQERPRMLRDARDTYARLRTRLGYASHARVLTSGDSQYKLRKNKTATFGLMLIPADGINAPQFQQVRDAAGLDGAWNLCPRSSAGCRAACLSTSGQSGMPVAQKAQATRTAFLLTQPAAFATLLAHEVLDALHTHARILLRLNTTSDIRWERCASGALGAMQDAGVGLYDYTAWAPHERALPGGYALTYSAKEARHTPDEYLEQLLAAGESVAVPFAVGKGLPLPATWRGWPVIDGDVNDERASDPAGVVVGLRAKGHAWKRTREDGFIRDAA